MLSCDCQGNLSRSAAASWLSWTLAAQDQKKKRGGGFLVLSHGETCQIQQPWRNECRYQQWHRNKVGNGDKCSRRPMWELFTSSRRQNLLRSSGPVREEQNRKRFLLFSWTTTLSPPECHRPHRGAVDDQEDTDCKVLLFCYCEAWACREQTDGWPSPATRWLHSFHIILITNSVSACLGSTAAAMASSLWYLGGNQSSRSDAF